MAGESWAEQAISAQSVNRQCAAHKDAFLTPPESRPAPPVLDPQSALFLDVDGTLLEIAPRPELVRVPPDLPALIDRLAKQREEALALISGRPLAQLDELFAPWHGAAAGVHGVERRRADGKLDCVLDRASKAALDYVRSRLGPLANDGSGVALEDKGTALALHYRAAPVREPEIRSRAEALSREVGTALRLIAGKMVVEFQPSNVDKGRAIAAFLAEPPFQGRRPVFVGDDTTDEDGFGEICRHGGWAIRVGPPHPTAAGYRLPTVDAVLAWLARSSLL
jgi:trehalose 6-phosphate phosphatase